MNWPERRREEGGSELIAHIRVIQVLPVADNWIDEDDHYINPLARLTVRGLLRSSQCPQKMNTVWLDGCCQIQGRADLPVTWGEGGPK